MGTLHTLWDIEIIPIPHSSLARDHRDNRFPKEELPVSDWAIFDKDIFTEPVQVDSYRFGFDQLKRLSDKHCILLERGPESFYENLCKECSEFKVPVAEKLKTAAGESSDFIINIAKDHKKYQELFLLLAVTVLLASA